jgi:hypothetical protein
MALMAPQSWSWFGRRGRSREEPSADGGAHLPATVLRAPGDPLEQFVVEHVRRHGLGDRGRLVAALTSWIARRERSIGGGALDLVVFPDAMWREEAQRALARLEGDLFAEVAREELRSSYAV